MNDLAASFEDAWERFQARDSLRLVDDTLEWEWTRGRAQFLTFQVRIEDAGARAHITRIIERIAGIAGIEPYPDWYWHATVKGAGFQVIKRERDDDVLRRDVPRMTNAARSLLTQEPAFEARLGLPNGFAEVAFLELWDNGQMGTLNQRLAEGVPGIFRYAVDRQGDGPGDGPGFLPHVSIARFRSDEGLDELKQALASLRGEGPGPTFPVRRIEFVKAWLSEAMPEFDALATYALQSPR